MGVDELTRRAQAVNQAYLALGNEQFDADGASFVRNREAPEIRDANHVTRITAASLAEIDRLFVRVEREFADIPHRAYHIYSDTPPAIEARLALEGYERNDALVMLLEGDLAGQAKDHDIRLVEGEDSWQAYRSLHLAGWIAYREAVGETDSTPKRMYAAMGFRPVAMKRSYWKNVGP